MAAGLGFKTFNTGDVLTAADTNGYLMQGVWVFANSTARDAAVTSPQEGNTCYLKDTDVIQVYSGSAWVTKSGTASPLTTKGDVYTYSTADARLGVGANDTVLTADSTQTTGLKWATVSSGLVKISETDFSGATSVNINDVFTSTYSHYKILWNINTGGANKPLKFNLRVSGSDATTNYNQSNIYNDGTATASVYVANTTHFDCGQLSATHANRYFASAEVFFPQATRTTGFIAQIAGANNADGNAELFNVYGTNTNSTSYTGFSLVSADNNIDGRVYVYGYQD